VPANGEQEVWRTNDDVVALTLKLAKAGREAVGTKRKERANMRAGLRAPPALNVCDKEGSRSQKGAAPPLPVGRTAFSLNQTVE
jgi:hypothetical protein